MNAELQTAEVQNPQGEGMNEMRVWRIGEPTEVYVAHSEEEMRVFFVGLVGESDAKECFDDCFEEIVGKELDLEFPYRYDDGTEVMMTWRKLAATVVEPTQISTSYN